MLSITHQKVDATRELRLHRLLGCLVDLLQLFIKVHGPVVVLLENIQHFDTASWVLLNKICEEKRDGFFAVVTLRPNDGSLAPHTAMAQVLFLTNCLQFQNVTDCKSPKFLLLKFVLENKSHKIHH